MKVTFIGIGQMGKNIAHNILRGGYDLTVWNRKGANWPNVEELVKAGAKCPESISEAVKDADIVGLSLTSDAAVKAVIEEAIPTLKKGAIVIDHSTASPKCAQEMGEKLLGKPAYFLDAPVSGGIQGAADATLSVMVGGDKAIYDKALPVLQAMGKNIHYMGPQGSGHVTKLINQILTGANQAVVCEAMVIGEKSGLDMNTLFNVLVNAWGSSRMLERSVSQYIIPKKYESAACLELMLKDFNIAIQMARDMGYSLPITELSKHFYEEAKNEGNGKMDHSYIIEIMKKENQLK